MSIRAWNTKGSNERVWPDNPMVVVENNDIALALQNLRRRKSDFGIIKKERRKRFTRVRKIRRYKRETAERKNRQRSPQQ